MFSLRYLRFVLCSRDLDVLRAQRIMGFFSLITHKSMRSENLITYRKCQRKIPLVLPETSSPDGPDLTSSQDLFTMGVGSVDVTVYVEVIGCFVFGCYCFASFAPSGDTGNNTGYRPFNNDAEKHRDNPLISQLFTPFVPICSQFRFRSMNKTHTFQCFSANDVIIKKVYCISTDKEGTYFLFSEIKET